MMVVSTCSVASVSAQQKSHLVIPDSAFLSEETKRVQAEAMDGFVSYLTKSAKECGTLLEKPIEELPAVRDCMAKVYYASSIYTQLRNQYAVEIETKNIAGVVTEIFTPSEGVSPRNQNRVLINLHGGGFMHGSRTNSHYASIPIAARSRIKVISVDYRMAPEHRYPAATEDVMAVYKELLKDYKPKNIGIFGCSAGAMLTAQSIARFQYENLPLPGVVGMLCGGAGAIDQGDSVHFGSAMTGKPPRTLNERIYFEKADRNDPLVFPALSNAIMAKFPPSLLVSSTRDQLMSSVVTTHAQLVALNVEADLHIFEGLEHAFIAITTLPESRRVHDIIGEFFDQHLGH
jgi:acetyl esterase/lipase